ncbi:hypothetical protein CANTEDRAFT_106508 [Yamadazyma tenuis ATCC 10573]|uniref:Bacterial surface antigen (D15) domain-containing protein n=2 Tax=Candida tenuis TaxID=2315449 RepID=G3B6T6_CANTC|nr:uncharacterized protein CANTEDRAFT_106508 [Yamadazyma tenuis ATCC 10573]EGV63016.1 hypothetical protein CANTEDRAFT_106508 [Yamadazyma tenuis ATCC 10573]
MNTADSKSKEQKELEKLLQQKQQLLQRQNSEYLNDLFSMNTTKPVKVGSIQVNNSDNFRVGFLNAQFSPLDKQQFTLRSFVESLDQVTRNFTKVNVLENLVIQLNSAQPQQKLYIPTNPDSMTLIPTFNLFPVKRFYAKTGSNIGNGEGDGYIQFQFKNLFGGAENVSFDATTGTRTSSSYLLNYNMPINNNTSYVWENLFYVNSRSLEWIGCETKNTGINTKISTRYDGPINHEIGLSSIWRILDNKSAKSLSILNQCGHNFKSALSYNFIYDTRNNKHLPNTGKLFRAGVELGGLTKLSSHEFIKTICETQFTSKLGVSSHLIFTNKFGFLHSAKESFILDRFFMGGPNDVRSFSLNGLGPKSYGKSLGGDAFLNGGVSLISRLPYTSHDSNFKLHNFFNYGALQLYNHTQSPQQNLRNLFGSFSTSIGLGVLYNHPMARFELNFVLPLTAHERDFNRKGLQYGVGISFL